MIAFPPCLRRLVPSGCSASTGAALLKGSSRVFGCLIGGSPRLQFINVAQTARPSPAVCEPPNFATTGEKASLQRAGQTPSTSRAHFFTHGFRSVTMDDPANSYLPSATMFQVSRYCSSRGMTTNDISATAGMRVEVEPLRRCIDRLPFALGSRSHPFGCVSS